MKGGNASYCFSIASILNCCITALLFSSFAIWVAVLPWKLLALNALTIFLFPWTYLLHLVVSRKLTLVGFLIHMCWKSLLPLQVCRLYFATLYSAGWIDTGGWKRPASDPHFLFFCGPLCTAKERILRDPFDVGGCCPTVCSACVASCLNHGGCGSWLNLAQSTVVWPPTCYSEEHRRGSQAMFEHHQQKAFIALECGREKEALQMSVYF